MDAPRIYSYSRFSSAGQAGGTSIARQAEYAQRYADANGLTLDSQLTMKDEGLSAFHGKHVKAGALGTFLRAVEDGLVPPGSVLIVEGLDRLSRAEPLLAQQQLTNIVMAGVKVVTASDGREYSRQSLKKEPLGLIMALVVMTRAHEESDTKSKRAKASIVARAKQWQAGTYRKPIGAGHTDPAWVQRTPNGFEFHPERAEAVRALLALYRQGYGAVRIVRELDRLGMSLSGGRNNADRVKQVVVMRALMGERAFEVDGEAFVLQDYYPALLTTEEFAELQVLAKSRGRRAGKGTIPHILTGMGLTTCGYCGALMVSQTNMHKGRDEYGLPHPGHRRIVCTSAKTGKRCPVGGSTSIVPIERAIMRYCSDQMNLTRLLEGDTGEQEQMAALTRARGAAGATQQQIDGLMGVILADPTAAPAAFAAKVKALETDLKAQNQEVERRELELAAAAYATPASATAWAELVEGVEMLDHDARVKARQLVADSFSGIEIARLGFDPSTGDGVPPYDDGLLGIFLHGRRGSNRVIFIDRKTGEFRQGHDIDGRRASTFKPSDSA